jgi:alkanesulfonate monooxygenase SsuD/methylene tetrahydromethanopterin reductase-like flavin-dependent oxidoreductase (luciferase family)
MTNFAIFVNPSIPYRDSGERKALAPIARNTEKYQQMLDEIREIAVYAEELGFDAIMTTEHHFHSEGCEASTNPLMLLADIAARTERIKIAPLGMVLAAWDPVRAAEDVAILDQLSKGRLVLGLARGYQRRWATTLFQNRRADTATYDAEEIEARNQAVFSEMLNIMKMCWGQDTVRYHSDVLDYSIPYPFEGVENWPAIEFTRAYGAPGELDDDDRIRAVSVVPKPYQEPHPEFWQPFAISERTLRRCAEMDILPFILAPRPDDFRTKAEQYQRACADFGVQRELGEHIGTVNAALIGSDRAELMRIGQECIIPEWNSFFGSFGYLECLRKPEDPFPPGEFPVSASNFERYEDVGMALVGEPEYVRRRFGELHRAAPFDWFAYALTGLQGRAPLTFVKEQMRLFAEHIIPAYRD